ncbi:LPXTG cell wall anchor domain-containing protein [Cohnella faecalis]|uniref:LPXTG cell wall anchor domain-containing protein n=1 Tax=Cohnella faecalis TaxID=2315694 RepID=A0A398CNV6_9BACL|nr:LPXTG cell wall anchor domain-containing protein [Cohnella faecalis]
MGVYRALTGLSCGSASACHAPFPNTGGTAGELTLSSLTMFVGGGSFFICRKRR